MTTSRTLLDELRASVTGYIGRTFTVAMERSIRLDMTTDRYKVSAVPVGGGERVTGYACGKCREV